MSEPRKPLNEGGQDQPASPSPPEDHGLSKMGGGESRGDGLDDDVRGGMIGDAEDADRGGMEDEG
jgi:hypothetical protein